MSIEVLYPISFSSGSDHQQMKHGLFTLKILCLVSIWGSRKTFSPLAYVLRAWKAAWQALLLGQRGRLLFFMKEIPFLSC